MEPEAHNRVGQISLNVGHLIAKILTPRRGFGNRKDLETGIIEAERRADFHNLVDGKDGNYPKPQMLVLNRNYIG